MPLIVTTALQRKSKRDFRLSLDKKNMPLFERLPAAASHSFLCVKSLSPPRQFFAMSIPEIQNVETAEAVGLWSSSTPGLGSVG